MKLKMALFSLFVLGFLGCQPEEDEGPMPEPEPEPEVTVDSTFLTCIHLTDANGVPMGRYGDYCEADQDWTNQLLTEAERNYFNPPEVPSWGASGAVSVTRDLAAYPNPVAANGQLGLNLQIDNPVNLLLRLAIIDEEKTVLQVYNYYPEQTTLVNLALYLPDDLFMEGQTYRLYYQLLKTPEESIYEGYGDIRVCNFSGPEQMLEACF